MASATEETQESENTQNKWKETESLTIMHTKMFLISPPGSRVVFWGRTNH